MTPETEVTILLEDDELSKPLGASPEETFWYWISERHSIFLKRKAGLPKPWTTDPVLQAYRFCNPFRENDKVTTWLRDHFIKPNAGFATDEQLAFNLVWFREFNRIETAEALGFQWNWKPDEVKDLLRERSKAHRVFTGAYIIRSQFGMPKIDSIVDTLTKVWDARTELVEEIHNAQSLQHVTKWLTRFPFIGDFMAFEMVSDMRHTRLLENATDIMTWANPGPGAQRGLAYMFGEPRVSKSGKSFMYLAKDQMLPKMKELLDRSEASLPEGFPKLEMRDVEHACCEIFKYVRGFSRQRYPGGAAA